MYNKYFLLTVRFHLRRCKKKKIKKIKKWPVKTTNDEGHKCISRKLLQIRILRWVLLAKATGCTQQTKSHPKLSKIYVPRQQASDFWVSNIVMGTLDYRSNHGCCDGVCPLLVQSCSSLVAQKGWCLQSRKYSGGTVRCQKKKKFFGHLRHLTCTVLR